MATARHIVHERMLGGAIDSYIASLDHTRPYLADTYEEELEQIRDRWLASSGKNQLDALDAEWLQRYVEQSDDPQLVKDVLHNFLGWAVNQRLITQSPLDKNSE